MGKSSYGFPRLKNVSYNGVPSHYISSNLKSIKKNYGMTESGYIGRKYKRNGSSDRRVFISKDPINSAKKLFQTLGRGGVQKTIKNKDNNVKGWIRIMKGGDIVTYRPRESSDGSTVIDINIISKHSDIKSQKIHFYKKVEK